MSSEEPEVFADEARLGRVGQKDGLLAVNGGELGRGIGSDEANPGTLGWWNRKQDAVGERPIDADYDELAGGSEPAGAGRRRFLVERSHDEW